MATHKLLLLPGDGIGPEVMAEVKRLIDWLRAQGIAHFETEQGLVGGSAYDASKQSITDATMAQAVAADAVIFGSVGGPKWDGLPFEKRAERGLLRVRKDMGVYANLRPALCFDALKDASTLKPEIVSGLDILIVRELMGGVYFGEPKQTTTLPDGQKRAVDTGSIPPARSSASAVSPSRWRGCVPTRWRRRKNPMSWSPACCGRKSLRLCTSAIMPMSS